MDKSPKRGAAHRPSHRLIRVTASEFTNWSSKLHSVFSLLRCGAYCSLHSCLLNLPLLMEAHENKRINERALRKIILTARGVQSSRGNDTAKAAFGLLIHAKRTLSRVPNPSQVRADETRLGTPSTVTEIETFLVPGASFRRDETRRERTERNAAGAR